MEKIKKLMLLVCLIFVTNWLMAITHITSNTTWTTTTTLNDDYIVDPGVTLTISPSSGPIDIIFNDNATRTFYLNIHGGLDADGSTYPITFKPGNISLGFYGVIFTDPDLNCTLQYCNFWGARKSSSAPPPHLENCGGNIYIDAVSNAITLTIDHCTFYDNSVSKWGGAIYIGDADYGITITNNLFYDNSAHRGGAIFCYSNITDLTFISNNTIGSNSYTHNSADYGAGIYCAPNSYPTIEENTISYNDANNNGGGVFCDDYSWPDIEGNIIRNNNAISGGGIYIDANSYPVITNQNNIYLNNASSYGGGIYCEGDVGTVISYNSGINTNTANYGGGIYCANLSDPAIFNNDIVGNQANYGGGIYCYPFSTGDIETNNIENNTAYYDGGGVFSDNSTVTISNYNTIVNNVASGATNGGGGIYVYEGTTTISHNQINNNHADNANGGGILIKQSNPTFGSYNDINHNTAGNGAGIAAINSSSLSLSQYNSFTYNDATYNGGGISIDNSSLNINNCYINHNLTHNGDGGGIYAIDYTADLDIKSNWINYNEADNNGGAIYCDKTSSSQWKIKIHLNFIEHNEAGLNGGGICALNSSDPEIINNLIDNCKSVYGGGIYFDDISYPYVNNNTVADNSASANNGGGGIFDNAGTPSGSYINNIIWNNVPNSANTGLSDPSNSYPLFSYCDIAGLSGTPNNNINADPIFSINNGAGPYQIEHLTSPCYLQGDPNVSPIETFDLLNNSRLIWIPPSPPNPGYYVIDMGAYQNNGISPKIAFPGYEKDTISNIDLISIYPNPASENVFIDFYNQDKNIISVRIIDVNGRTIENISQGLCEKGRTIVTWHSAMVNRGIYFCKISINYNIVQIKKIILN